MAHHRGQLLSSHCGARIYLYKCNSGWNLQDCLSSSQLTAGRNSIIQSQVKIPQPSFYNYFYKIQFQNLDLQQTNSYLQCKDGGWGGGGVSLLPIGQLCLGSIDIAVDTVSQYQPWHQTSTGCLVYIAVHLSTDTSINLNVTTAVRDSFHVHRYIICIYGCYSTSYKNKTKYYNFLPINLLSISA